MKTLLVTLISSGILFANGNGRVVVQRGCGLGTCYAQPVVAVQAAYVTPVAWHYAVGADRLGEERLRKLEEAIIVQQQVNAQLARIVSGGGAGNVSQTEIAVRRVFANNCLKCHNGAGAKAGMDLTKSEFNVFDKALVSQMVGGGQMPPPESGIKLSKADEEVIQTWAGESAEEFRLQLRSLRQSGAPANGHTAPRAVPGPAPLPQQ